MGLSSTLIYTSELILRSIVCRSPYHKLYYAENRERILARQKRWCAENPEAMKARSRRWYEKNKERLASSRKNNRERLNDY